MELRILELHKKSVFRTFTNLKRRNKSINHLTKLSLIKSPKPQQNFYIHGRLYLVKKRKNIIILNFLIEVCEKFLVHVQ